MTKGLWIGWQATDEIQRLLEKEGRYKDDLKHAVLASTQSCVLTMFHKLLETVVFAVKLF